MTGYLMGREDSETQRLIAVAEVLNPSTRRLLIEAGLGEGMRVLDVGTGAGDVALVAAELVGPTGSVVGLDQNPQILRTAFARAQAARLDNVSFVAGDCLDGTVPGRFDAIIGRLVLMYVPDPAATLRRLAGQLTSGGVIAFQDYNLTVESCRTSPETPLWRQAWGWIVDTAAAVGIPAEVGFGLRRAFVGAGLPAPAMRVESYVGSGADVVSEWMAESVRSMSPFIARFGIATAAETEPAALAERLRAELLEADAVVKAPDLVGAWTRT